MKKWLLIILGGLVALAAVIFIIGLLRPASHVASVTIRLPQVPDSVWAVIANIEGQTAWAPMVRAVERLPDNAGRPAYKENYDGFEVLTVVTESVAPAKLVKEILPTGPFYGTWTWELAPEDTGTQLTITERGTVANAFLRGMMLLHDNEKSLRDYVSALQRRLTS